MKKATLLILIIFTVNLVTFMLYVIDKRKAVKSKWRISERTLLLWSLLAPWGGFTGMKVMHHKTKHKKFTILVPVFMILHIILLLAYIIAVKNI